MSWVLNFGSRHLEATMAALLATWGDRDFRILVLTPERCDTLDYSDFNGGLEKAELSLKAGKLASFQLEEIVSGRRMLFAGVYCPNFCGEILSEWTGVVEGFKALPQETFEGLLKIPGLNFVILSRDEPLDLNQELLESSSFPWDDWRLISAAVRNAEGHWQIGSR